MRYAKYNIGQLKIIHLSPVTFLQTCNLALLVVGQAWGEPQVCMETPQPWCFRLKNKKYRNLTQASQTQPNDRHYIVRRNLCGEPGYLLAFKVAVKTLLIYTYHKRTLVAASAITGACSLCSECVVPAI